MSSGPYAGVPDVGTIPGLWEVDPVERTAPDGRPWLKCCGECAFRDKDMPQWIEDRCAVQGAAFYCVHRETVGGYNRVCAGFAARQRRAALTRPTPEQPHDR